MPFALLGASGKPAPRIMLLVADKRPAREHANRRVYAARPDVFGRKSGTALCAAGLHCSLTAVAHMSDTQPESSNSDQIDDGSTRPAASRRAQRGAKAASQTSASADAEHAVREKGVQISTTVIQGAIIVAAFAAIGALLLASRRSGRVRHSLLAGLAESPARWVHAASDAEHELVAAARRYAARLQNRGWK